MLYWTRFPFIRITFFFVSGILAGYLMDPPIHSLFILVAVNIILYIICWKVIVREYFLKYNGLLTFLAFNLVFLLGITHTIVYFHDQAPGQVHNITSSLYYYARIDMDPGQTERHGKAVARILSWNDRQGWHPDNKKIVLYFPINQIIRYGDSFLIRGHPALIEPPLNQYAFNYKEYMARKKIHLFHFLDESSYRFLENRPPNPVVNLGYRIRHSTTHIILQSGLDTRVKAILIALLTGQRDYFGEETYSDFTQTGIVHILAVSGLHVGIIYMVLLFLLTPLSLSKKGRLIRAFLIIGCFFMFALITGLSPSVLRAVVMFSFMIAGNTFNRNSHILNTVFLSAFLLLSIKPVFLFELGFQLSYAAVTGIILFQPLLYSFLSPKYFWLDWIWKLSTVSIAAQLSTLPLTLFYFKQFPSYFLLGNIFAIPFVTLFIPLGLFWVVLSPLKKLHLLFADFIDISGKSFLACIEWIGNLPGAVIEPVNIGLIQVFFIFIFLGCLLLMVHLKIWKFAWFMFLSLGIVVGVDAYAFFSKMKNKQVVVHKLPSSTCFELVKGRYAILVLESLDKRSRQQYDFHIRNYCIRNNHIHSLTSLDKLGAIVPGKNTMHLKVFLWEGIAFGIGKDADLVELTISGKKFPDFVIREDPVFDKGSPLVYSTRN